MCGEVVNAINESLRPLVGHQLAYSDVHIIGLPHHRFRAVGSKNELVRRYGTLKPYSRLLVDLVGNQEQ